MTSPSGATIYGQIVDGASHRWRLQFDATSGLVCVMDDTVDRRTANVVRIWIDDQKRLCQENVAGGTWYYDGTNWIGFTAGTAARPTTASGRLARRGSSSQRRS
jgi:hypothetical protein